MPVGLILFALFLGIPLMEIAAFVVIGGKIGLGWTLAMVVVTAVIGSALLRMQSFSTIRRIQAEMDAGRLPGEAIGHGVLILVAGLLLLTPGFVTDAIGFALFVPAVRSAIWHFVRSRMQVHVIRHGGRAAGFESGFEPGGRPGPGSGRHTGHPNADRAPGPVGGGQTIDLDEDDYTAQENPSSPWRQPGDDDRRQG
ncbi:MAG: membrane protein FxsA [Hyphomicrobiales bacterium]|nr:MAG: membrane protein FxsA [Hyphomicrobiales bacterium]